MTILTWNELLDVVETITADLPYGFEPDWPAKVWDAWEGHTQIASADIAEHARENNPLDVPKDAFPKSLVPLAHTQSSDLTLVPDIMRWGFAMRDKNDVVFNTRLETASSSPFWRDSFRARHCIVPVHAFYEPHKTELVLNPKTGKERKQLYRFTQPNSEPLLLAGIWEQDRFSLLTTKPNEAVAPVHDRMPLVLDKEGARGWLFEGVLPVLADEASQLESEPLYAGENASDKASENAGNRADGKASENASDKAGAKANDKAE